MTKSRLRELDELEWVRPNKEKQSNYGEEDESLWREDRQAALQQRQIQRYIQLERMFPQPGMPPPPPPPPPRTDRVSPRPPLAGYFREAVERDETIDCEFEGFKARAQDALTRAEHQGDKTEIKKRPAKTSHCQSQH